MAKSINKKVTKVVGFFGDNDLSRVWYSNGMSRIFSRKVGFVSGLRRAFTPFDIMKASARRDFRLSGKAA